MLRSHFGIPRDPFDPEGISLLPHQREILDILLVHAQQGGLCLLLGEPGAGKSVLKQALLTGAGSKAPATFGMQLAKRLHSTCFACLLLRLRKPPLPRTIHAIGLSSIILLPPPFRSKYVNVVQCYLQIITENFYGEF